MPEFPDTRGTPLDALQKFVDWVQNIRYPRGTPTWHKPSEHCTIEDVHAIEDCGILGHKAGKPHPKPTLVPPSRKTQAFSEDNDGY